MSYELTNAPARSKQERSPDGLLRLTVAVSSDGDVRIGFRGFRWHTHADILATMREQSEEEAVRCFVNEILRDNAIIAVLHIDESLQDVWITNNPEIELRHTDANERVDFRYWSGRFVTP